MVYRLHERNKMNGPFGILCASLPIFFALILLITSTHIGGSFIKNNSQYQFHYFYIGKLQFNLFFGMLGTQFTLNVGKIPPTPNKLEIRKTWLPQF